MTRIIAVGSDRLYDAAVKLPVHSRAAWVRTALYSGAVKIIIDVMLGEGRLRKFHTLLLVLLVLLCRASWGVQVSPVSLADAGDRVSLGMKMQILEDPEGNWTLDQVRNQFASRFRNSDSNALNFGFTQSTIWLRFAVDASHSQGSWFLVERYPILDELTLFVPQPDGEFREYEVGDTRPFGRRPMDHRSFVFNLESLPDGVSEYYLKVRGKGALNMMPMLYSAKGLVEYTYLEQLLQGLFYGSLTIMLIYNLLLFLSLRDNVHLHFVVFLAGVLFFNICVTNFLPLRDFGNFNFDRRRICGDSTKSYTS